MNGEGRPVKLKTRDWKWLKFIWLFLLAAVLQTSPLAACQKQSDTSFPSLGTTHPSVTLPSQPSGSEPTESTGKKSLTAALPMNQDALDAVRLLFLAKKSGLLSQEAGQYIGQQINPEDLRQFDGDLDITLIPVPISTGATMIQISSWQASAMLPDIIYCQDAVSSLGLNHVIVLDDLLYDNHLLSASHVYPKMLESGRINDMIYCIPYLASTPLIYMNRNLLNQLQLSMPDLEWTWLEWFEFARVAQVAIDLAGLSASPDALTALKDATAEADLEAVLADRLRQALFVTDNPAELLPFLPAAIDLSAGYAMWDGNNFQLYAPSFKAAAGKLSEIARAGYSLLHLDASQIGTAFGSGDMDDAVLSGRLLLWTGDSAEITYWHQQLTLNVADRFLPAGSPDEQKDSQQSGNMKDDPLYGRLPVTVRSLFVTSECQEISLAAEFAAFAALDADSLLLQSRYQLYEGLFPVIQDKVVWDACVGRQTLGSWLTVLRDRMPYVYCSGQQKVPNWQEILTMMKEDIGPRLLMAADDAEAAKLIGEFIGKIR